MQMTPEMAQAYMQMMRGQMVGGLARGGEASDKVSKDQAGYSKGHKDSHCGQAFDGDRGYCRYFIEPRSHGNLGTCQRVEGAIARLDWCKLWRKAKR